jgi:probable phosphomutase (TIGR03848 family)
VAATTILLVRHAACEPVGRWLAGRTPGIGLDAEGRGQAAALGHALAAIPLHVVCSSPLQRATETAAAIAAPRSLPVLPHDGLIELDFGAWTGRTLDSLADEPGWHEFNTLRSLSGPPGGELMAQAQARAVAAVLQLAAQHAGRVVAAVSHADIIRAVLCHVLGTSLDHLLRIDVAPASVSTLVFDGPQPRVAGINAPVMPCAASGAVRTSRRRGRGHPTGAPTRGSVPR